MTKIACTFFGVSVAMDTQMEGQIVEAEPSRRLEDHDMVEFKLDPDMEDETALKISLAAAKKSEVLKGDFEDTHPMTGDKARSLFHCYGKDKDRCKAQTKKAFEFMTELNQKSLDLKAAGKPGYAPVDFIEKPLSKALFGADSGAINGDDQQWMKEWLSNWLNDWNKTNAVNIQDKSEDQITFMKRIDLFALQKVANYYHVQSLLDLISAQLGWMAKPYINDLPKFRFFFGEVFDFSPCDWDAELKKQGKTATKENGLLWKAQRDEQAKLYGESGKDELVAKLEKLNPLLHFGEEDNALKEDNYKKGCTPVKQQEEEKKPAVVNVNAENNDNQIDSRQNNN